MGINSTTKIGSVFPCSRFVENNIFFLYMPIIFQDERPAGGGNEF